MNKQEIETKIEERNTLRDFITEERKKLDLLDQHIVNCCIDLYKSKNLIVELTDSNYHIDYDYYGYNKYYCLKFSSKEEADKYLKNGKYYLFYDEYKELQMMKGMYNDDYGQHMIRYDQDLCNYEYIDAINYFYERFSGDE